MVKIAILNLYLHQLERRRSSYAIRSPPALAARIPASCSTDPRQSALRRQGQDESILADLNYKLNTRATELLFLKWFIDHLTPGGRAGVIVPNGVLFGRPMPQQVRELLSTECDLQAVISLPSGVFKPYAGVATAALIFQKGRPTKSSGSTK